MAVAGASHGTSAVRKLLAEMVLDLDDRLVIRIPILRDNEALRLLIGYIDALTAGHALSTPDLQNLAAVHVRDLVAVALGATRGATAFG
ncbi:MAG: hypothetical protein GEV13_31400 [Rhodospirillales bacterium]|nr:hypothetical protein [Rhodospirillales bacterium]